MRSVELQCAGTQQARCPECGGPAGAFQSAHKPGCSVGLQEVASMQNAANQHCLGLQGKQSASVSRAHFMDQGELVGTPIKNAAKPTLRERLRRWFA